MVAKFVYGGYYGITNMAHETRKNVTPAKLNPNFNKENVCEKIARKSDN